ncbi:MAG: Putative oxidoreductase subunit [uncultured Nocardioidaceae bacterium]|uniref:Oxidoreductase subunit n=1 Tax=uncultured Nocardioidaceae bacterium TaxID=253824 RepID=A0A6J4MPQ9_9ACTN|nr:MAG: Putative oxidoreductase subunit [uncultured Nocardioidaceae bacterium]
MSRSLQVRKGAYVDSVTLMQASRSVAALPGVHSALVAMATELNLDLATTMGFTPPAQVSPNEMLVAVAAESEEALTSALAEVDRVVAAVTAPAVSEFGGAPAPLTIRSAARSADAQVALISTPGRYAVADAVDAIDAGLHTMIFSDNVSLEHEVALKRYAASRDADGVIVMGPDCGTAVIGGVGLGFANVVRPGPVGIVAASGTGAQHLMTLLDGSGVGVSHCVGVGGRDLSEQVGALSTVAALDLLAADEATELVVVVSKPPAPGVAQRVQDHADRLGKPVVLGLLGEGRPDITETAHQVVTALGLQWQPPERRQGAVAEGRPGGRLRGLFAGGTLRDEAMILAKHRLGTDDLGAAGHLLLDFGDDELTQGRPHPMIDGSIRVDAMLAEIKDERCGVLLLDLVLGHGATLEPAAELSDAVRAATTVGVPVLVSLVGTRDDPQDRGRQAEVLHQAGAWVFGSNAQATRTALDLLVAGGGP